MRLQTEAKEGTIVALFTQLDSGDHRFWLAKVTSKNRRTLKPGESFKCPCSGEDFEGNASNPDVIMEVRYFDRLPGHDRIFRYRPELGTYYVRTSMIRAAPVVLDTVERVSASTRQAGVEDSQPSKEQFELSEAEERLIMNRIVHEFQDNE